MSDSEINIEVAKRLGYSVYHYDKDYASQNYFTLMDETGEEVILGRTGERKTAPEAWEDALEWSTNLNLAIDLVAGMPVAIEKSGNDWKVVIEPYLSYCSSLARAICEVWLRHAEATPRYEIGDHVEYKGNTWQVFEVVRKGAVPPNRYRLESLDKTVELRESVIESDLIDD